MAIALPVVTLDGSALGNIILPSPVLGEITPVTLLLPSPVLGEIAPVRLTLPTPTLTDAAATTHEITMSGGVLVAGGADIALDPLTVSGSGGVVISSSAGVTYAPISIHLITAQGGANISGAATVGVSWLEQRATGGVNAGGTSTVIHKIDPPPDASSNASMGSSAAVSHYKFGVVTSTAAMTSTGASPTIFWEVVASASSIAGSAAAQRLLDATVSASVVLNGAVIGSASYHVSAASLAEIVTGIQFVQDFWDGWAFNLNNNAPSFYENFKFNSFARIGKNYYGCNDSGIHLLGAELDGASAINSTITLGTSDLSTERFDGSTRKAVPEVFVAARSVEPLKLTCRVEGQEYTYTFTAAADVVKQTRVEPGKGLLGTFWQFELTNQNGADFEILSLTAKPYALKRRL